MENSKLDTGMYIIDKEYRILNVNQAMMEMYPEVKIGDVCYRSLALREGPCAACPLENDDVLFFNPFRKEWISANAAQMEYPGCGECYNVQFKMRKSIGSTEGEYIRLEEVDEHLVDLKSAEGRECIIGAYLEQGAPLFFANENMIALLGYETLEEMAEGIDGLVVNIVHPDDREHVYSDISAAKEEGDTFETMFRIPQRDGSWLWTILRGKIVKAVTGKLAALAVCSNMESFLELHDVLNEENQALLEKEQQTELIFNQIPGSYHRCAAEEGYPFLYISKSFEDTVGWTKEEIEMLFDNKFIQLVYPEDIPVFAGLVEDIDNKGNASKIYRIKHKDGGFRWVQDSTMLIESGDTSFYQCTLADITEFIKQHEKVVEQNSKLRQNEIMFEAIVENIPSGFHRCETKPGAPFLYVGEHFLEIVGWSREELVTEFNNCYLNLIWPEDSHVIEVFETMIESGGTYNHYNTSVYRVKHKDGGYRWVTDSTMYVDLGENGFCQGTITDITPYIEELEKAKNRAESSNRAKSTFLFNLSHDIRTPMNAIHGFTQMLKQNPDNGQLVREVVEKIDKSSNTLNKLLSDVLELSRIESGKEKVDFGVVDLKAFSDNLVVMMSKEIEKAGITFEIENSITDNYVLCDELKLTQITMNMLSNAKKFTPAGGKIVFGAEQLPDVEPEFANYRFYVRDTGIGMSEEFLSRAFEQFERERTATESGILGSGLGLSIIKNLTELIGGTCTLKSKLGEGTEISAIMRLHITKAIEKEERDILDAEQDFSGKRVLLVEDNEFNREIARFVLEGCGLLVEEAEDGARAVNRLLTVGTGYFDLVLMDIQMPVMDGYTATAEIRCFQDTKLAAIPIIAMTANAFKEDQERCIEVGMNGHISKPIDIDVLKKVLAEVLRK